MKTASKKPCANYAVPDRHSVFENVLLTLGECTKVTVVSLCVCVCVCSHTSCYVLHSFTSLYDTLEVFDLWILLKRFLFKLIYLSWLDLTFSLDRGHNKRS